MEKDGGQRKREVGMREKGMTSCFQLVTRVASTESVCVLEGREREGESVDKRRGLASLCHPNPLSPAGGSDYNWTTAPLGCVYVCWCVCRCVFAVHVKDNQREQK